MGVLVRQASMTVYGKFLQTGLCVQGRSRANPAPQYTEGKIPIDSRSSMAQPKSTPKFLQALVTWTPFGIGAVSTIESLLQQEVTQTAISSFFTGCSLLWAKFSGAFMAEAEQEMEKMGTASAKGLFKLVYFFLALFRNLLQSLTLPLIQFWWEVTSDFKGKYYKRLDYLCRNFEAHGLDKERICSLQQSIVTVNVVSRSLAEVSPNLLRKNREDEALSRDRLTIGDFLAVMRGEPNYRRLAILGAPGSGKTTLMRYITLMYALGKPRRLHPNAPNFIPVLLYLRDIHGYILKNPDLSLADLLTQWVQELQRTQPLEPPKGWFDRKLRAHHCLILLDGLDEIADRTERQQVSRWVDRQMYEYDETAFILTSRPLGYDEAKLQEDVQVLEVQPLTEEQIEEFVQNWYVESEAKSQRREVDLGVWEDADRQVKRLLAEIQGHEALRDMASNPLLLTMIATVHRRFDRLPFKRIELYDEICQVLLEKRQRAKGLPDVLTASQKRSILQPLALDLMCRKTQQFTLAEAQPILDTKLANFPGNQLTSEQFLKRLQAIDALVAKECEDTYELAHLSFQEYLAAVEIQTTHQEDKPIERLHNPEQMSWWAETMRLYAAYANATNLVRSILDQPTFEKLVLACDFWRDRAEMQPDVQKALLEKLNEPLAPLDAENFEFAAKVQPRYFKLAYYLQTGQWKEADLETWRVMLEVGDRDKKGYLDISEIDDFPCDDLRIIDRLWVNYSNGKFGFSVQKEIYQSLDGTREYDEKIWNAFGNRVGWRKEGDWLYHKDATLDLTAPVGHLPLVLVGLWCVGRVVHEWEWWVKYLFSRVEICEV